VRQRPLLRLQRELSTPALKNVQIPDSAADFFGGSGLPTVSEPLGGCPPGGVSYVPSLEDLRFLNRDDDVLMGPAAPEHDGFLGSINLEADYMTDI
jgi:hypothetical protein